MKFRKQGIYMLEYQTSKGWPQDSRYHCSLKDLGGVIRSIHGEGISAKNLITLKMLTMLADTACLVGLGKMYVSGGLLCRDETNMMTRSLLVLEKSLIADTSMKPELPQHEIGVSMRKKTGGGMPQSPKEAAEFLRKPPEDKIKEWSDANLIYFVVHRKQVVATRTWLQECEQLGALEVQRQLPRSIGCANVVLEVNT